MKLATKKKIWLLRQLCNLNTLWGDFATKTTKVSTSDNKFY